MEAPDAPTLTTSDRRELPRVRREHDHRVASSGPTMKRHGRRVRCSQGPSRSQQFAWHEPRTAVRSSSGVGNRGPLSIGRIRHRAAGEPVQRRGVVAQRTYRVPSRSSTVPRRNGSTRVKSMFAAPRPGTLAKIPCRARAPFGQSRRRTSRRATGTPGSRRRRSSRRRGRPAGAGSGDPPRTAFRSRSRPRSGPFL